MTKGRYGIHGGQYIPETLMNAVIELEEAYNHYKNDKEFNDELNTLLNEYAGRPSRLYYAKRMTEDLGGAKIYLKREDLNHTGAHKINNVLGQVLLAKKMGYIYVDTGAMYRSVAFYCIKNHIDLNDEQAVEQAISNIQIRLTADNKVYLNDEDVSLQIRTDEVSLGASCVSKYQAVRTFLVDEQRKMAETGNVILDGRDIGTVVLPHADLKIYQIASVETRAKRRYLENKERGLEADLETIKKEIEQRDYQDMHRAISPLKKADDAIELDTSNMTLEEVVDQVLTLINKTREE